MYIQSEFFCNFLSKQCDYQIHNHRIEYTKNSMECLLDEQQF